MEYMSEEGFNKILNELKQLESVELPRVRDAISEARAQGDLSENFEYHAAKREQGRLLGRIRFLSRILEHARVIDRNLLANETVGLLSKVEMTNLVTQAKMTYTIVSQHEADLRTAKMSIKSPIAQALLGKKVGDVVSVRVPAGTIQLRIDSITLG
ncbi:MAG: transcription elongation factor GreA [Prevotella sp.]|nr:transcription elongation factor GreA [Prevotella sp.]MDY6092023.1 transcription elongation factor GreA [Prevotella sp.]